MCLISAYFTQKIQFVLLLACPAAPIASTPGLQSSSTGGAIQTLTCTDGTFSDGLTFQTFLCNIFNGQWSPSPATTVCGGGSGGATGIQKDLLIFCSKIIRTKQIKKGCILFGKKLLKKTNATFSRFGFEHNFWSRLQLVQRIEFKLTFASAFYFLWELQVFYLWPIQ
jgi:hypothetical protein